MHPIAKAHPLVVRFPSLTPDMPAERKLTTPISEATALDLIEWWWPAKFHFVELAWDTRRIFGDARGWQVFQRLATAWAEWGDIESDTAVASYWAEGDRIFGPLPHDLLWIDAMAAARSEGWSHDEADAFFLEFEDQWCGELLERNAAYSEFNTLMGEIVTDLKNEAPTMTDTTDLITSSGDFVRGFVPPDYLVDGILQRRFCYSLTAATGAGKTAISMRLAAHVLVGRPLGTIDVQKGSVIYFAGENPTDIQMRWLGLSREMEIDPVSADIHFLAGAIPLSQIAERITAEILRKGIQPALVIVDTSAAYFETDDENSNAQAAAHARRLRSLTMLPGGPCVLVNCHPTKRASDDDLIPRGGGAFLAEVDGNIAVRKADSLVVATAQGKYRGPEFAPLSFELQTVTHPLLRDTRGRNVPTVIARPVSHAGILRHEASNRADETAVLHAIDVRPGGTFSELARHLSWTLRDGSPNHPKVRRLAIKLKKEKLVDELRGGWRLTEKGQKELNALEMAPTRLPFTTEPRE